MNLLASEIRVLGCLLEKQRTTPDSYPLSLNALRLACNQSTSRDPVVNYDDGVLRDALHRLERRGYTRLASGAGSRAPKYRHLLDEALPMAEDERALLCVLMLRGAQTPGELKQRADRLHAFGALDEVHHGLARLIERGLVEALERRPGQKEERYRQLLGEGQQQEPAHSAPTNTFIDPPANVSNEQPANTSREQPANISREPANMSREQPANISRQQPANMSSDPPDARSLEERIARLEQEVADLRSMVTSS